MAAIAEEIKAKSCLTLRKVFWPFLSNTQIKMLQTK